MGAVAVFNYDQWIARYPEFAAIPADQAALFFAEATVYHRNDGFGPVADVATQTVLLYMLTAHVAALYRLPNGAPSPANAPVGKVNSASEGSVSASFDSMSSGTGGPGEAWFLQTKYGSSYWFATAPYRTMRYRPSPTGRALPGSRAFWPYRRLF